MLNQKLTYKAAAPQDARPVMGWVVFPVLIASLLFCAPKSFGQDEALPTTTWRGDPLPKTWVDPDTGHQITRVSDEPGSASLYFNVNAYTPDGLDMIYESIKGIYDLNLATLQSTLLVQCQPLQIVVGTKTRRVFFVKVLDHNVYAVDIDTKQVTQVAHLPPRGKISTVNADETLLAGTSLEGHALDLDYYKAQALTKYSQEFKDATAKSVPNGPIYDKVNSEATLQRFAEHAPQDIFTLNLQTGQSKVILKGTDWLNHVLFSPTDPTLLMYDHEGPSLEVNRIWTIRADGSQSQPIRQRADATESVTHEFWSHDGQTIWYDFQKPKGHHFFLAGHNVSTTGQERLIPMKDEESSVHFNISADGKFFCGDGDKPGHGDKADRGQTVLNRQWIWLKTVLPPREGEAEKTNAAWTDRFHSERLVNMSKDLYVIEPSARFSPDGKYVFFTSDMFGPTYVFMVEVNKASNN